MSLPVLVGLGPSKSTCKRMDGEATAMMGRIRIGSFCGGSGDGGDGNPDSKTKLKYSPCQCRTRFHRFTRTTASTDDGFNLERVGDTNLNSSTDYSVEDKNDDISVTSFLSDEEISENVYMYVYPMRDRRLEINRRPSH